MKITIGGVSGTGTSTISKMLGARLGYKRYSGGDMQRMNAADMDMTIEEYDQYLKSHPELDNAIEERQRKLGLEEDDFILESRIGWSVIPDAVKIKLDCELDERIRRITDDSSLERIAHEKTNFEKTKEKTLAREATYQTRFNELYNIDDWNADEHFDLIIDTTTTPPEEVVSQILEHIQSVNVVNNQAIN